MTDIQDVLREMREDADSPEVRGLDEVMLNRWADTIEAAMREKEAEIERLKKSAEEAIRLLRVNDENSGEIIEVLLAALNTEAPHE